MTRKPYKNMTRKELLLIISKSTNVRLIMRLLSILKTKPE